MNQYDQNFTPHPHLKDMPRGFTQLAYDALDEDEKSQAIDYIPAQQTATGGWFDLVRLSGLTKFQYDAQAGSSFYIGHVGSTPIGYDDDRHIMLTASSRSGKGVSHIIPNLILYKGSVLTLDPKGELASKTARRRGPGTDTYEGLAQKVCVLDPFKITEEHVAQFRCYYNPFEDLLHEDANFLVENADLLADALVVQAAHGDNHWDETAKALIAGIILHLATYPAYNPKLNPDLDNDPRHLIKVYELLMGGCTPIWPHGEEYTERVEGANGEEQVIHFEGLEGLFKEMQLSPNPHVRFAAIDIASKPPNEQGSVISTARRHLKFLASEAMRDALMPTENNQGRSFKLEELKTNPKGFTLYICLPSIRLTTHRALFRLLVNMAFASIEQLGEKVKPAVKDPNGNPIKTLFLFEEAHTLGPLKAALTASALFASYGIRILYCFQDLNQAKLIAGNDCYQSLLGNCGVLLFYNNPDPTTLGLIETLLGKTSIVSNRFGHVSLDAYAKGNQADSKTFQTEPLLTGEEACRLFARDKENVLVITPEERPIVLKRIKAYQSMNEGGLQCFYDAD